MNSQVDWSAEKERGEHRTGRVNVQLKVRGEHAHLYVLRTSQEFGAGFNVALTIGALQQMLEQSQEDDGTLEVTGQVHCTSEDGLSIHQGDLPSFRMTREEAQLLRDLFTEYSGSRTQTTAN